MFQNSNIHNTSTKIPSQFQGHAVIEPKSLLSKQNVIYQGIYCQNINENDVPSSHEKHSNEQISYTIG